MEDVPSSPKERITQPHDRIFRAIYSDPQEAALLAQKAISNEIGNHIDWNRMRPLPGSFLDPHLKGSQSDLLYQVEYLGNQEPIQIYLLFEHQSSPNKWMAFRLLKYMCRIWDAQLRTQPRELQPIVPIVFYQGPQGWTSATEFDRLFPEPVRALPWIPQFTYERMDQTNLDPKDTVGGLRGRLVQLHMMAAFERRREEALELAAQFMVELERLEGPEALHPFFIYLMANQKSSEDLPAFNRILRSKGLAEGVDLMTYAQQVLEESRQEGRAEGLEEGEKRTKVQMIEGLLQEGATWKMIEPAAKINQAGFESLKEELRKLDS